MDDRVEFKKKLHFALHLRNKAEEEYQELIHDTRYLSDRIRRPPVLPSPPRGGVRKDSIQSALKIADKPPVLRPLDSISMISMTDFGNEGVVTVETRRRRNRGVENLDEKEEKEVKEAKGDDESISGSSSRTSVFNRWRR